MLGDTPQNIHLCAYYSNDDDEFDFPAVYIGGVCKHYVIYFKLGEFCWHNLMSMNCTFQLQSVR